MDEASAVGLVELARANPRAAYEQGQRELPATRDAAVASLILQAMGNAARWVRTTAESIALLEDSVARAVAVGRHDLAREARLTLAGSQHLAGDLEAALATLDLAAAGAASAFLAKVAFQRATIMGREGHPDEALVAFTEALHHFESVGDRRFAASTLGNRGMVQLERGRARDAALDFRRAQRLFEREGMSVSVAWMEHNLGRVDGALGDVRSALARFHRSEEELGTLVESSWEAQVNRCEVLLQAGLFDEAAGVAGRAVDEMNAAGLALDQAEATLVHGIALLALGRHREATALAERAATQFDRQRRPVWAAHATAIELRSRQAAGDPVIVEHAVDVARRLATEGQKLAAAHAWAVVARGDPVAALAGVQDLNVPLRSAPLELRLTELEIRALAHVAVGETPAAMAATSAAVVLARRHQLTLGASDVRLGVSAQLDAIAQLGLEIRLGAGRAWPVVRWVDRCRGAGFGAPLSSPSLPSETRDLLAALRAVHLEARSAAAQDVPALIHRQALLQRRLVVAERSVLQRRGDRRRRLPTQLRATLSGAGVVVIQHHRRGGQVGAVVIDRAGPRLVELGALEAIHAAQLRVRHAFGRLVAQRSGALADLHRQCATLQDLLVPRLDEDVPTVIVPLPRHCGVPWAMLPALAARPVTVAPTLGHWVGAGSEDRRARGGIGVVEGAGLLCGSDETFGVAAVWAGGEVVRVPGAGVATTLELLARVSIAHLTCHGERRAGDGRFASLVLADGALMAFDIERLERSPPLVVMSACESGLVDSMPGEESVGLLSAFFGRGTDTVIASPFRLPDAPETSALFVALHRGLAAGRSPSTALFDAQQSCVEPPARAVAQAISCFGRG